MKTGVYRRVSFGLFYTERHISATAVLHVHLNYDVDDYKPENVM